jgi:uncharacterized membrane protein YoaT (DUF817 family)
MLAYTKTRFHEIRIRFESHVPKGRMDGVLWEIFLFGFKQGWACLFGGILLSLLLLTKWYWPHPAGLARYDFLFLSALAVQALLLILRMETVREAKVILIFHLIGTVMEIFKTGVGSWAYPESSFFRIGHVPLFSGFMYASVGSYLARTTRIMEMRYTRFPRKGFTAALAVLIYLNFFAHHFMPDMRIVLFAAVAAAFGPTWVYYRPYRKLRRMPLLLGFCLVTLFIWAAENIGTFATAWVYPNQRNGWQHVDFGKFGSWFLLMIISFILVSLVHPPRSPLENKVREETSEDPSFARADGQQTSVPSS